MYHVGKLYNLIHRDIIYVRSPALLTTVSLMLIFAYVVHAT